jgi:hypothetical protein
MKTDDQELSPETRELLTRGRHGHSLSEGHRKGMKRSLLVQVAAGGLTTTTAAAAWTGVTAKTGGAVALFVLAFAGFYEASAPPPRAPTTHATPATGAGPRVSSVDPQLAAPRSPIAPGSRSIATPPSTMAAAPPVVPSPPPATMAPPPPPTPLRAVTPTRSPGEPAPGLDLVTEPASPATASDITMGPAAAAHPSASLEAEARLLGEADRALKHGDAPTALRLLDEHAKQYPASVLEPERSTDHVLALCTVGRVTDARREGAVFLAAHPSGPLASRVRSSCGGPDN